MKRLPSLCTVKRNIFLIKKEHLYFNAKYIYMVSSQPCCKKVELAFIGPFIMWLRCLGSGYNLNRF